MNGWLWLKTPNIYEFIDIKDTYLIWCIFTPHTHTHTVFHFKARENLYSSSILDELIFKVQSSFFSSLEFFSLFILIFERIFISRIMVLRLNFFPSHEYNINSRDLGLAWAWTPGIMAEFIQSIAVINHQRHAYLVCFLFQIKFYFKSILSIEKNCNHFNGACI